MNNNVIEISSLYKSYGKHQILDQIDITIPKGTFAGLVGENGVGKTTLIKCILDFCSFENGNIQLFGIEHKETASRSKVTYLPEKFLPPYYLTGEEFLRYMAELHGVEYKDVESENMLKILDLDKSALQKPVRQYSKGMGQKLGLMACFLSNKELMVFDEPMSGLDPRARAMLKQHLMKLKIQGKTLFYSTHLLEDIQFLCDQVIILHDGKVCFSGTITECYSAYNVDNLEAAYLACTEVPA